MRSNSKNRSNKVPNLSMFTDWLRIYNEQMKKNENSFDKTFIFIDSLKFLIRFERKYFPFSTKFIDVSQLVIQFPFLMDRIVKARKLAIALMLDRILKLESNGAEILADLKHLILAIMFNRLKFSPEDEKALLEELKRVVKHD